MKGYLVPALAAGFVAVLSCGATAANNSQNNHKQPGSHGGQPTHAGAGPSHGVVLVKTSHYGEHGAIHHASHHGTVHHVAVHHGTSTHVPVHLSVGNAGSHHFNARLYQHNYTAKRQFHAAAYVRPHGWYYRRWNYGEIFPRLFWSRDYWIADYEAYGLIAPPYDCEWVRYGDDALLVDLDTGEILQVIYGLYY